MLALLKKLFFVLFAFYSFSSLAHHGFAVYFHPDRTITIEGIIAQYEFVNPHSVLYIESTDGAGDKVMYTCALQAKTQLVRRGADENLFVIGDPIKIVGFPARRDPYGCEFGTGYFANGETFTMRSVDEAQTQFARNERRVINQGVDAIYGNWIRPDIYGAAGLTMPTIGKNSITPEGEKIVVNYDRAHENPTIQCDPGSPVRTWGAPGLLTSIRREDNKIIIHHESMDWIRTIHLDIDEHPENFERNSMGHSIGRFEENVLVINTSKFPEGILAYDIAHTDEMTLEEKISFNPQTGNLDIYWAMNEPNYYLDPISGGQSLESTTDEFIPYGCTTDVLPADL
ncbi:MAG: hypothetical protein CBC38_01475 [Gammaproteobacteria bacterium TMED78]|nr:MAG: hypothetical protein CBC38_01475 [Gammaproteobacteria bacterium TMED78]|tara:strand:+ start:5186 stop:6211 length:1026 start_codon:yes stop_codon:yes gene_type:complete